MKGRLGGGESSDHRGGVPAALPRGSTHAEELLMRSTGKRTTLLVALLVATSCLVPLVRADALPTRGRMRKSVVIFKPGAVPDVPARCQQLMGAQLEAALPTIQGCVGSIDETQIGVVQGQSDVQ